MTTQPPIPPAQPGKPDSGSVPTCYRHPDRETYVRCQRCERPICPDCMREAAVGHQCVECVRGDSQGTRQARTAFGGRMVANATVTWTLIGLNVLLFLVELGYPHLADDWGLLGYATVGGPMQGIAAGQWYRLLTSAFLPPATGLGGLGFLDILFNMWALFAVGPALEQLLGRVRFLAVYLLSAIGGGGRNRACSRLIISLQIPGCDATPVSQNNDVGSLSRTIDRMVRANASDQSGWRAST